MDLQVGGAPGLSAQRGRRGLSAPLGSRSGRRNMVPAQVSFHHRPSDPNAVCRRVDECTDESTCKNDSEDMPAS